MVVAGSKAAWDGQPSLLGEESGPQGLQEQSGLPKKQVPQLSAIHMEKTMLGHSPPQNN